MRVLPAPHLPDAAPHCPSSPAGFCGRTVPTHPPPALRWMSWSHATESAHHALHPPRFLCPAHAPDAPRAENPVSSWHLRNNPGEPAALPSLPDVPATRAALLPTAHRHSHPAYRPPAATPRAFHPAHTPAPPKDGHCAAESPFRPLSPTIAALHECPMLIHCAGKAFWPHQPPPHRPPSPAAAHAPPRKDHPSLAIPSCPARTDPARRRGIFPCAPACGR